MQQTNFPFEILVHEDASTDNTSVILREYEIKYPNLFRCVYQSENQFFKQNTLTNILFPMSKGKYIAFCEGDDYWTDPHKLQKQVDFLEENPDYNIVWTKFSKVDLIGNLIQHNLPEIPVHLYEVTVDNFFEHYRTFTLTTLVRRESICVEKIIRLKYAKDNTIFFMALKNSKGKILDINTACYRMHDGGTWSTISSFKQTLHNYNNVKEIRQKILGNNSLKLIEKSNIHWLVNSVCGVNNCKLSTVQGYKSIFWLIVKAATLRDKIRYGYWFLKFFTINKF